jgi:hypothetical protein
MMDIENSLDPALTPKRRGRGKGKKPPLVATSVRLPGFVHEWFKSKYPYDWQSVMRMVLTKHVESITGESEEEYDIAQFRIPD